MSIWNVIVHTENKKVPEKELLFYKLSIGLIPTQAYLLKTGIAVGVLQLEEVHLWMVKAHLLSPIVLTENLL